MDASTCVVCYREMKIVSIGECDHPVCFECSTRMRVLCRQNECPICRKELPKVIFAYSIQPFRDLCNSSMPSDRRYRISFESEQIRQTFASLLEHVCKICDEKPKFPDFTALKDHSRSVHGLFYCSICAENLKIFSRERSVYTRTELAHHNRKGDPDNSSHRGHPLCEFCNERYADADLLYRHMRRDHFFCHLCDADGLNHYYCSYDDLRDHFKKLHYFCEEGDCREEKFVVFRTDIDFKAHKAQVHLANASRGATKQVRSLEVQFSLIPRHPPSSGHVRSNNTNTVENNSIGISRNGTRSSQREQHGSSQPVPPITEAARQDSRRPNPAPPAAASEVPKPSKAINVRDSNEFPSLGGKSTSQNFVLEPSARSTPAVPIPSSDVKVKSCYSRNALNPISDLNAFPSLVVFPSSSNMSQNSCNFSGSSQPHRGQSAVSENHQKPRVTNVRTTSNIKFMPNSSLPEQTFENFPALPARERNTYQYKPPKPKPDASAHGKAPSKPQSKSAPSKGTSSARGNDNGDPGTSSGSKRSKDDEWWLNSISKARPTNVKTGRGTASLATDLMSQKYLPGLMEEAKENLYESRKQVTNVTLIKQNDLPTSENAKQCNSTASNVCNSASNPSKHCPDLVLDFPVLTSSKKHSENNVPSAFGACPPPGFGQSHSTPRTSEVSVLNLPPGFFVSLGTNGHVENASLNSDKKPGTMNGATENGEKFHQYIPPTDFASRNASLMETAKDVFRPRELEDFRVLSVAYRQGSIDAKDYHKKCLQCLNNSALFIIFSELLALLPDIEKQNDLWTIHKNWLKRSNVENGSSELSMLSSCTVCHQVLVVCDVKSHMNEHKIESSYPSLPDPANKGTKQLLPNRSTKKNKR